MKSKVIYAPDLVELRKNVDSFLNELRADQVVSVSMSQNYGYTVLVVYRG